MRVAGEMGKATFSIAIPTELLEDVARASGLAEGTDGISGDALAAALNEVISAGFEDHLGEEASGISIKLQSLGR